MSLQCSLSHSSVFTFSGLGEERLEWPARGVLGFPVGVPQSEEVLRTARVIRQEVLELFPHLGTLERLAHRMDGDALSAGQQRHPLEGLSGPDPCGRVVHSSRQHGDDWCALNQF